MAILKRLNPQMSKLVAQLVYQKHQAQMIRETAEARALVLELLNRGYDPRKIFEGMLSGDTKLMAGKSEQDLHNVNNAPN